MFWGDLDHGTDPQNKYRLLLEAARYADANGFAGLWVPERHFHPWGGHYPNPAVLCAALATVTQRIRLRSGSVVLPLHHPLRVAEEWAVVDNLSGGRVELSVASGWKDDDFILAPERFANRQQEMWKGVETLRALWRGEKFSGKNGSGETIEVAIYPRPLQPELPLWVTSAGALKTMTASGRHGFGLLTHLLGQTLEDVETRVQQYKAYRVRGGFETPGRVALMLHTFVGQDLDRVRSVVKKPFIDYLKHSADLAGGPKHSAALSAQDQDELAEISFQRYFETGSLLGTPSSCRTVVERLKRIGVTDVCCLIDFAVDVDNVLESLTQLASVMRACNQ